MTEKNLLAIQIELRKLADETRAQHSQQYFKAGKGEYGEGDIFLGIRVPELRKFARQYKSFTLEQILNILSSKFHEERLMALFMLIKHFEKADQATKKIIYNHYVDHLQYINNWDLVDSSAPKIVGAYLYDKNRKPLYKLAKSKDLWSRRIAILSTLYFINNKDYADTLKISEMLLHDKEDIIHKAVGWMLREVGNQDFTVERRFLDQHYKTMPRTMLRYAIEKFPSPLRHSYLKGEI